MRQILNIVVSLDYDDNEILTNIKKKYGITPDSFKLYHRSLDARRDDLKFNLKIEIDYPKKLKDASLVSEKYHLKRNVLNKKVAVIGAGPSGLFAAYILSAAGCKVSVFERGGDIHQRVRDVDNFLKTKVLNPDSNISFGEGGAGTFSDGKLTSRSKDEKKEFIKDVLVKFGAKEEILVDHKPHIGTDKMRVIIYNMREEIKKMGATFHFNERLEHIIHKNNSVHSIVTNRDKYDFDVVILALGNASRDTFLNLLDDGLDVLSKPFAIGFRIEHKRSFIDRCQFKKHINHPRLLSGEYQLTADTANGGVYSFCMCPGGVVVPSSSETNLLSVNGMSYSKRDLPNSNSAIVNTINGFLDPRESIEFSRNIERIAFELGGKNMQAPAIHVIDFLEERSPKTKTEIIPSYPLGVKLTKIDPIFPSDTLKALREGLLKMEKKMKGFTEDAIITAVESKTSSPVKIPRDENFESNIKGVYPIGEGAGYAGGIISAALDGLKCAEKIMEVFS